MNYYDNVKDTVKDKGSGSAGFDTLKKAAEETSEEDEDQGDDTPIEVLEEGGLDQKTNASSKESSETSNTVRENFNEGKTVEGDFSGLEEKLDKIIEQNAKMIEILESFAS